MNNYPLLEETNYKKSEHDLTSSRCGKERGNGGGWGCENRYQKATKVLGLGYVSDTGHIVWPLKKKYRLSGKMPK